MWFCECVLTCFSAPGPVRVLMRLWTHTLCACGPWTHMESVRISQRVPCSRLGPPTTERVPSRICWRDSVRLPSDDLTRSVYASRRLHPTRSQSATKLLFLQRLLSGPSLPPTLRPHLLLERERAKQMERWQKALSETPPQDFTGRANVGVRKQHHYYTQLGRWDPGLITLLGLLSIGTKSLQNMPMPCDAATHS